MEAVKRLDLAEVCRQESWRKREHHSCGEELETW